MKNGRSEIEKSDCFIVAIEIGCINAEHNEWRGHNAAMHEYNLKSRNIFTTMLDDFLWALNRQCFEGVPSSALTAVTLVGGENVSFVSPPRLPHHHSSD
jgi:hypothetical protein